MRDGCLIKVSFHLSTRCLDIDGEMFHLLRTNQSFDFRFMQWRTASRRQIHNDALRNQHWPGETPHYPTYVMYKNTKFCI